MERIEFTPQFYQAASASFEVWREMERVEVCADVTPDSVALSRNYGCENPNTRVDYSEPVQTSRRARRALHLREITEQVGGAVRIGSINRFKI